MTKFSLTLLGILAVLTISASGCEAIGGIFKAGIWTGVIGIALVVFLILFLIGKSRK